MRTYYEAIDESLYIEAGEKNIVQVEKGKVYISPMLEQNRRVLSFLKAKYPEKTFRLRWHKHEFGEYQEIEVMGEYEDEEDY